MKNILLFLSFLLLIGCTAEKVNTTIEQPIVSQDIANFWTVFDAITATEDSLKQQEYLQTLFLDKASVGQKRMIEARNYTADQYLNSINEHGKFWASIRANTQDLTSFNEELNEGVASLRAIYPALSLSTIYYTIGAHRSPGTGVDSLVLIGTEFALGDRNVDASELPEHLQNYYKINPVEHLKFLIVHEYVHTQQKEMVHNLLSLALYEGIGDFVAFVATGQTSPFKAFAYGPENEGKIKKRFEEDMFNPSLIYSWLWNSPDNEFGTSDLGYYIGYTIAATYYENAIDKNKAIKELIELDYQNETDVEKLVNSTQFFSQPLEELYQKFETQRPTVLSIQPFENGSQTVSVSTNKLTIQFSEPMHQDYRNFEFGPLGETAVVKFKELIGYSADGRSLSFEIEPLSPNKQYQLSIGSGFRNPKGLPLKPYLIDFKTSSNH